MSSSFTIFLADDADTASLGETLARHLIPGDTVLLEGQIGAGKSHLARAAIKHLARLRGLPEPEVPSPTFTLIQTYDLGSTTVWHADLYRLGDASELIELGFDDALQQDIVLVEWPDRMSFAPKDALSVHLVVQDQSRTATLSCQTDRWQGLQNDLASEDA